MTTQLWAVRGHESDPLYVSGDANTVVRRWVTLSDLTRANKATGGHWFDPATLRYFGSYRREIVGGAVVECRRNAPSDDLRYGVTWFDDDGTAIGTVSTSSRERARTIARRAYREGFVRVVAPWETTS